MIDYLSRAEKIVVLFLFMFLLFSFSYVLSINYMKGYGDNALAADLVTNISKTGRPDSLLAANVLDILFRSKILSMTPEAFQKEELKAITLSDKNFFKFHFTPVYYLVAPLVWILPVEIALSFVISFSFLGLLFLLYLFLRKKKIPPFFSLIFIVVFSLHPAWHISAIGQVYADRFFLFFGSLLIYFISSDEDKPWSVFFAAILCGLVGEKTALIAAIFLVCYTVLNWRILSSRMRLISILSGCLLFIYAFVLMKIFLNNTYYSSFLSFSSIINFIPTLLKNPVMLENTSLFAYMSIIPLALFCMREWKAALIALIMMGPNIFGNIGGAEKTGWLTHYHSIYLPFLIWACALGYASIYKMQNRWKTYAMVAILAAAVFVFIGKNPISKIQDSYIGIWKTGARTLWASKKGEVSISSAYALSKEMEKIIPEGSIVTIPEYLMVNIYKNRNIFYYPLGLEDADYAVVYYASTTDKEHIYTGAPSYMGAETQKAIDRYLTKKMAQIGYDVDNPQILRGYIAVIKNKKLANNN